MTDFNQFGSVKPGQTGDPQHCAQCETMLIDALDGTLSPPDQATFDTHVLTCQSCAGMLADSRRGTAWIGMLHSPRPEPPAELLELILAQTSAKTGAQTSFQISRAQTITGASSSVSSASASGPLGQSPERATNTLLGHPSLVASGGPVAVFQPLNVLPFRTRITKGLRSVGQTMLQPRLAMTAAMAFFSIALTLNLTGIRLGQLHASDLKPANVMRSCYEAKAKVVRYSDNLRVVYELESRVRDLQQNSDDSGQAGSAPPPTTQNEPAAQPGQKPAGGPQEPDSHTPGQKQSRPKPGPGSSRREIPGGAIRQVGWSHRLYSTSFATEALVIAPFCATPEGALV